MNKHITPEQLELVSGFSDRSENLSPREEVLLARAPHIDPESPAFKADLAKVDKISLAMAADPAAGEEVEFNWHDDDSIILREQRATAAYRNRAGELIIRQKADWDEERDTFVFISPENEVTFLEALAKRQREG
ncbi:hypothetical protein [Bradyrhizobium elkanii]|uniref:hypothetical protein n=1 Tax=Bradyrhizobium elkanii TaxID=29448 RepID=UPI0022278465|nr:hypothetical protein [Bradyrhizobium elkanii]MCW2110469.1 hypothetical protein [Bradyrhizobium elkanii]WLB68243.1 hypothetical protein QIH89_23070 [Bradyrhizobium elkanii]